MTIDSDDEIADSSISVYQFSTTKGLRLARKVLRQLLPYDPHDDQLEGICKMIDGINLMALTRTGSGKTGYFIMYMLLLLVLSKDPRIVAPAKKSVPKNPVMVLVFPTNGVEEEMVSSTI
jgi:superfamily II DNA/RNA helicase